MDDGSFWILTDNGFGSKANSPDSMLYLNHYRIDWASGKFERLDTVFLHDPDKKVPFRIVNEGTEQALPDRLRLRPRELPVRRRPLWIGEEFGPYLIKADREGKVLAVFETQVDGKAVRSPDHPAVTTPAAPGGPVDFNVRRSKGFEGMAASKDGKFSTRCSKGRCGTPRRRTRRSVDGKEALRILEFDVAEREMDRPPLALSCSRRTATPSATST